MAEVPSVKETVASLHEAFNNKITRSYEWRLKQLTQLKLMLTENLARWQQALEQDLGASKFMKAIETTGLADVIQEDIDSLATWMKPKSKPNSLIMFKPGAATIVREPYGVVLIISPFNYPLSLSLKPAAGAIAAGNCVLLKPSEVSSSVEKVFAELIPKYLDPRCIRVVCGGPEVSTALLAEKFDYIFYTGSTHVGKIVMTAAAKNLTPVTLELGGKSPVIVDENVDLDAASRRIISGKFNNCSQTCVAPDYLLIHKNIKDKLVPKLLETITSFYGKDPEQSKDIGRMINQRHWDRVMKHLEDIPKEKILMGGNGKRDDRYIAPTVIDNPSLESLIMKEEIFGPLLPFITIDSVEEACKFIVQRPKPLALYIFSTNQKVVDYVTLNTSSGGLSINETIFHVAHPELPFGGVGDSGMGAYNGKATFKTFSHSKSVYSHSTWIDPASRYPPYTEENMKMMKVGYAPIGIGAVMKFFRE